MEVLFVSHKFPPSTGGMEKQCYELLSGMEKKCKVHRLVYEKKGSPILFFLLLPKRLTQICKDNPGICVIYFNDALIASYCSFFKIHKEIVYIATLHGLDVVFPSAIYHQYIFKRLNRFHCMVAVSNAAARKAMDLGIDPDKVVIVPNGVSTSPAEYREKDDFRKWLSGKGVHPSGKKLLMLMGRPVKRKGFSWFTKNVLPLIKKHYFLIIAGPFHFKPTWKEKIVYSLPENIRHRLMLFLGYASDERDVRKILKNSPDVMHVGRLSPAEIEQLLKNVDAFLMPNIRVAGDMEGFGLVCLEASVQNTLVFASDIDGIPDAIIHKKNGLLLPPEDAHVWADTLNDFAENARNYEQYKRTFGQFTKDHYNWEYMVDAYYALFEKLNNRKNGKHNG